MLEPFGEYFAVVDGASVTSTKGPGIIKDLRNKLIDYKKEIDSDPYEDWSGVKEDTFVYHYLYNDEMLEDILKDGKLLPVDSLDESEKNKSDKKYAERNKKNDADAYRRSIYAEKFEKVLDEPYSNYGIYLTPCDLFFDNSLMHRFKIPISKLSEKTVIQVGKEVELFNIKKLKEVLSDLPQKEIEKKYWKSKKHFMVLPQVIEFGGELQVDESMVESNKIINKIKL